MIQIESIHVEEVRGIRDLTLDMNRQSFVISGPNGSGKSGVVDAIEFGLTGEIGRLKGKGTGGLSLATHGPHVDKRDYPDSSLVRLKLYVPELDKSVTITRNLKKPKQAKITPNDDATKAILDEVAAHPEITLSRREIIKFILSEATERSRDVQTLLKLDEIDQTRSTLKTVQNKLGLGQTSASSSAQDAEDALRRHLDIPKLTTHDLLAAVNRRRRTLQLAEITELDKDTSISEGIAEGGKKRSPALNKESALRDLEAARGLVEAGLGASCAASVKSLLDGTAKVEEDPGLLEAIRRRSFIQTGLELVVDPHCPLCDREWDIEALRVHLQQKLEKSKEAEELQQTLLSTGAEIATEGQRILELIKSLQSIAAAEGVHDLVDGLATWSAELGAFAESLSKIDTLLSTRQRLENGWTGQPDTLLADIDALTTKVSARPDESATVEAQSFLTLAQDRLTAYRRARRSEEAAKKAAQIGRVAYKTYCDVAESALMGLYKTVEGDFTAYYRSINQDDEGEFEAKLDPTDGKLDLSVDFYKRGMFPPGAYHSEGHQDGMGVCLYLALMKRVMGGKFTLAVLDDVVMSVDSRHRKQFCKLLKNAFPDTQFVITTHDSVWARQLRTEGLVPSAKSSVVFHGWSVETGPITEAGEEIWAEIDRDLAKNDVPGAASRARRYLEYTFADLADRLMASPPYRADGGYDLGDFFDPVIRRHKELLGKAAEAAQSWKDSDAAEKTKSLKEARSKSLAAYGDENWVVNKAVHYNEWADGLTKEDFDSFVTAIKDVLQQFRCSKCASWLYVTPRKDPGELRCDCFKFHLNLKLK